MSAGSFVCRPQNEVLQDNEHFETASLTTPATPVTTTHDIRCERRDGGEREGDKRERERESDRGRVRQGRRERKRQRGREGEKGGE